MNDTDATLDNVRTDVSVSEGRVGIAAENERATVRLKTPRQRPLTRAEPALLVEVSGDGLQAAVWFDGDDAAALARVLADVTDATEGER